MGTLKELLAKPDAIRITTPPLSRETMQKVLDTIRHDVAADKIEIDNPTPKSGKLFSGSRAQGQGKLDRNFRRDFGQPRGPVFARRARRPRRHRRESWSG